MELRCQKKLHGILNDGVLEVKCSSRFCGARPGIVVIHRFDPITGETLETKKFSDPAREREVKDASRARNSVRSS